MAIHVEESALNELKSAIANQGESYKNNLARLTNLINEITRGDIQGDLAVDLLNKFQAKQATFNGLATTIDEAAEYMGMQTTKFGSLMEETKAGMR